jgi:hypothetical protein
MVSHGALGSQRPLIAAAAVADKWSMRRTILVAALAALAVAAAPADASAHSCAQGDPPIEASSRTSCPLAVTIVNQAYRGPLLRRTRTIRVRSPVTHERYTIRLVRRGDYVTGAGRNGIWVRFFYCGC